MPGPRLALVPGEPAGVGPELCVRLVQHARPGHRLLAFGDPDTLVDAARRLRLPLRLLDPGDARDHEGAPGDLALHPVPNTTAVAPGEPDPDNARAVVDAILAAADACRQGACAGLVTGPVHKATINAGGIAYTGTTGLLADHAGRDVVMMLANDAMRVALATTHLPLRDVADAIEATSLARASCCLRSVWRNC